MTIVRLVVSNFKSYKGTQTIGPFHNFQAIIGPNGAGKSNLMDAISFVLLVSTRTLRGANLRELIYKNEGNLPSETLEGYVEMVLKNGEKDIIFRRTILANGSCQYEVSNKKVKEKEYEERLKNLGIIAKSRNFLVFQGDVESIAAKTPKELTQMIEQISGSDLLKEEYEQLLTKKSSAEEDTIYNFQKKKGFKAEKKEVKAQKEEAERYNNLLKERADILVEHILYQLFHVDKDMKERLKNLVGERKKRDELQSFQSITDQQLADKKKEQATLSKENTKIEKTIRTKREESQAKRPEEIKIQQ